MEQFLGMLPTLDKVTAVAMALLIAYLVITEKLIWHKRFDRVRADRDRWQAIALNLAGLAHASVRATEVAVDVVSALPDPEAERENAGRD